MRPRFADTNLPLRIYILRKNYYSPESTLSSVLLLLVLPIHRQIVSSDWVIFLRICSSTRVQELQSPFCIATHARLASVWIQYGGSVTKVYFIYSYSRVGPIERTLNVAMWSNTSDTFEMNYSIVRAVTVWIRQRAIDRLLGVPRYQSFSTTVKSFSLPGSGHTHIVKTQNTSKLPIIPLSAQRGGWGFEVSD